MTVVLDVGPLKPEDEVCDFCSDPHVVGWYDAASFHVAGSREPELHSIGGWDVCAPCKELIEAEKWEELAQRSTDSITVKYPELVRPLTHDELLKATRELHEQFRLARYLTH